ncbi:hypothetical protein Trydic_g19102 [Trypoxylus dichotomus]
MLGLTRPIGPIAIWLNRRLCTAHCRSCHYYTDKLTCCLVAGDGVGPELINSVERVFKEKDIPIVLERLDISKNEESSVNEAIQAVKRYGVCLKSPFENYEPTLTGSYQNFNVKMRVVLDVYASVVHVISIPGIKTRHENLDFYIIREQTEAAYASLEHESVSGIVESLKVVTWKKSTRIAKFAFDYATRMNRKKVTCVHKANIMKLSDGLFLKCCNKVSKLYPRINYNNLIVDNTMMQIVTNPQQFDVIVTQNLYGNIADNLGAGLVGGAGICAGAAYSRDCVIFEPAARHTYSKAAGKNIANPTAILLCAVKMLRHVNLIEYADRLKSAVFNVLKEGKVRTRDIGGKASTTEFTSEVIKNM